MTYKPPHNMTAAMHSDLIFLSLLPSLTFALAILPSFLFLKPTNVVLLQGLCTCYFLSDSHSSLLDFTQVSAPVPALP